MDILFQVKCAFIFTLQPLKHSTSDQQMMVLSVGQVCYPGCAVSLQPSPCMIPLALGGLKVESGTI